MNQKRYRFFSILIVGHLVWVALGAKDRQPELAGAGEKIALFYNSLSGASGHYDFFAPGLYSQLRARIDWIDSQKRIQTFVFGSTASHEANLRVGNILSELDEENDDPVGLQRALTASFARKVFALHPQAQFAIVKLEEFKAVSMEEYRAGLRPAWQETYRATYSYHPRIAAQ